MTSRACCLPTETGGILERSRTYVVRLDELMHAALLPFTFALPQNGVQGGQQSAYVSLFAFNPLQYLRKCTYCG